MKLIFFIIAILITGILLIAYALLQQQPLEAQQLPVQPAEPVQNDTAQQVELEVIVTDETQAETSEEPEKNKSPAQTACARLIEIREEELEDAQEAYNDAVSEQEDVRETYEDIRDTDATNETISYYKTLLENAEDAEEAEEQDLKNTERKLRAAKIECGVY